MSKSSLNLLTVLQDRRSVGKSFFTLFGLIAGTVALVFCTQVYSDINEILKEKESDSKLEYLQVNKVIGYGNTLGLTSSSFSKKKFLK